MVVGEAGKGLDLGGIENSGKEITPYTEIGQEQNPRFPQYTGQYIPFSVCRPNGMAGPVSS